MALGVAQGMQALEGADPPILHRDLNPRRACPASAEHLPARHAHLQLNMLCFLLYWMSFHAICSLLRSNVLLDAAGVPHVADMGLARRLTPANAASLTGETGATDLGRAERESRPFCQVLLR